MTEAIAALLFVGGPGLLLVLCRHFALARKLGPIVLCYAAGLLIGLTGLLPEHADAIRGTVTEASLALALPLLLFSVDILAWRRVAGRAMLSMFLAVLAVVAVATLLFFVFSTRNVTAAEQLTGMTIGMYTGGIANLGAIKLALDIPDARYLLFATVDTVAGTVYLLFVLTAAPRIVSRILAPFPGRAAGDLIAEEPAETYRDLLRRRSLPSLLIALCAAALCVGLAVALAPLVPFSDPQIMVIVLLTSFGLAASFLRPLRENSAAPRLGMYLIYVFSFAVAASVDLRALSDLDPAILSFVVVGTFGSLALHLLLCRLAGIDADTFLVTSVAALMSPAFVPMVTRSLRNPAVLMSGMTTGILGFAIGNYLGITVALILARGG